MSDKLQFVVHSPNRFQWIFSDKLKFVGQKENDNV